MKVDAFFVLFYSFFVVVVVVSLRDISLRDVFREIFVVVVVVSRSDIQKKRNDFPARENERERKH